VQQESLWENAGYVAKVAPEMMPPIALGLQAEAEFFLRDMDSLAAALQRGADDRSRRAQASSHEWALLMFALLACLALAVFEPLVRMLRRQHEKLVAQAAETRYLALAAQRTGNGVVFTDRDHRIVWVNEGFSRLSGYAPHEVIGARRATCSARRARRPRRGHASSMRSPRASRSICRCATSTRTAASIGSNSTPNPCLTSGANPAAMSKCSPTSPARCCSANTWRR
jgi:PAS domain-containing protein